MTEREILEARIKLAAWGVERLNDLAPSPAPAKLLDLIVERQIKLADLQEQLAALPIDPAQPADGG